MKAASRLRRKQSNLTDSDRKQSNFTDSDHHQPRQDERERQTSPVGKALSDAASQRAIPDIRFSGLGLDHFMSPSVMADSDQDDSDLSDSSRRGQDQVDGNRTYSARSAAALSSRQSLSSRFSQPNLRRSGDREHQSSSRLLPTRDNDDPPFLGLARDNDDNRSIEAVRNDQNHRRLERIRAADPSSSSLDTHSESDEQERDLMHQSSERLQSARSIRKVFSQPEIHRVRDAAGSSSESTAIVPTSKRPSTNASTQSRLKTSVSTILKSARDATPKPPSIYPTNSQQSLKSSSRSLKNSAASVRSGKTAKSAQSVPHRATVRNARGEIEWKDGPPMPDLDLVYQTQNMSLQPPERLNTRSRRRGPEYDQRTSSRSPGYTSSDQDYYSPPSPSPTKVPFRAFGAASKGRFTDRPSLQRHASEESGGYHTANDDDIEAREWERSRERQMEMDRFDVYQQQQHREEEMRIARRRAERERAHAESRERERIVAERRRADREARRLEREKAEQEEQERRKQERAEAEARRLQEREQARLRKLQAQKEAEERKLREEQEAKEREIQEKKEAEERAIREKKEAEEREIREAEEAKRKAEEEIARKEAERLAAIEADRLAREAAIQAAKDAIIEKARQLAEAKRQVIEEDKAARRSSRRDEKRAQRALNAALPEGQKPTEIEPVSDDDDSDYFDDVEASTGVVRNSSAASKDAKSSEGSASNPEARSSTDGSSDMPATPADEKSFNLGQHVSTEMRKVQSSDSTGEGHLKYQTLTNGESTPTGLPAKIAPYKPDRFRLAVQSGARKIVPTLSTPVPSRILHPTEATISENIVQPDGPYREGGITYGRGWCAHGLADPSLVVDRRRYVRIPPHHNRSTAEQSGGLDAEGGQNLAASVPAPDDEHSYQEVMYSDSGELIWTATTPDVLVRLVSHLNYPDIKALRQTSRSIRFALGQLGGREIVLARFLAPVGYEAWKPAKLSADPKAPIIENDPMPLTFSDCEDFLLSFDLLPEYRLVGAEFARAAHKMDPRYPRLARATTRAYNRVLTRLRMQPDFRVPTSAMRQDSLPVSPLVQQGATLPGEERVNVSSVEDARSAIAHSSAPIVSPWKPARAGFFRAWVPSREVGGWLSDIELARCERELFIAGVWPHLKKGDVVWDCAIGDERNEGKYIFDGRYLRDLSFMFDRVGHLPSWLNAFTFVPSYYHNIVQSGDSSEPVVYLDVLPWRDQIVSTMRLVQDQVETLSPQGARYRISKWLYRAVISVTAGQVLSEEGIDLTDSGWHGRIVIETEGTAEHAKELVSRCAGPAEGERTKARLLASVMDSNSVSKGIPKAPAPIKDAKGNQIDTTSPWAIVRARSRPGLIWIRPLDTRDRVVF